MEWKGSLKRTCRKEGERWNRNRKVCATSTTFVTNLKLIPIKESNYQNERLKQSVVNVVVFFFPPESQKKKSNQDDSDEDDDDDDEAGPSTQQMAAVQPQPGYGAPMAQLGMPPVAGTPGMHPGGYQGKKNTWIQHKTCFLVHNC